MPANSPMPGVVSRNDDGPRHHGDARDACLQLSEPLAAPSTLHGAMQQFADRHEGDQVGSACHERLERLISRRSAHECADGRCVEQDRPGTRGFSQRHR